MQLTEEQILIRDMARKFSVERLAPGAAARDREARFPGEELKEMGELGLMGMLIPEEWGGAGAGCINYALTMEEIAAGDGATSTILGVQSLSGAVISGFASNEQKERFLPPIASGEHLAAFMLTEPHTGSDASNLKVKATKEGNHYKLSGTKQFITTGAQAQVSVVFAITDDQNPKKEISAFIVPTDLAGYTVTGIEKKLGQRGSDTAQITFEDVELTPDLLLGEEGEGYKIALANLEGGRIGIAAQATGMARAAYEAALDYAKERTSFGKRLIEHQAVAFRLADMATNIEAARLMYLSAARLRDAGEPCLKEASMAKLFASEMAEKVCSGAIQTFGGYGYVEDFPVERIYRDVRVCQIYEGTSDVQRLVISRAIEGE